MEYKKLDMEKIKKKEIVTISTEEALRDVVPFQSHVLECAIRVAFNAGQEWAETYSGWFTPRPEETEEKIQAVIKQFSTERNAE